MMSESTDAALPDAETVEAVIVSGPRHGGRMNVNLSAQGLFREVGPDHPAQALRGLDEALEALLQEARQLKHDLRALREAQQPDGQLKGMGRPGPGVVTPNPVPDAATASDRSGAGGGWLPRRRRLAASPRPR
jgi:hypothetical protein